MAWPACLATAAGMLRTAAAGITGRPATTAALACASPASAAATAALPFSTIAWSARSVAAAVSIAVRT